MIIDLFEYEKQIFSQHGEDGVIEEIFNIIGTRSKFYVEFGATDGHHLSNTKYLREFKMLEWPFNGLRLQRLFN